MTLAEKKQLLIDSFRENLRERLTSAKEKKLNLLEKFQQQKKVALDFVEQIKKEYSEKASKNDLIITKETLSNLISERETFLIRNMDEIKGVFESFRESQLLANGILDGDLREIEQKINEIILVHERNRDFDNLHQISMAKKISNLEEQITIFDGGEL